MKALRRLLVTLSLLVMFLGLAVTGTKAQTIRQTHFAGNFTLTFPLQWGNMILPPGGYNIYYGNLSLSGPRVVEISHESMGILHSVSVPVGWENRKSTQSVLVCVFEGNKGYVRSLEMAEIGQSINFKRPHFVEVDSWIVAGNKSHAANTQLAVVRIPVAPVK